MNYKIQGAIKKSKKTFIIAIVLWVFIAVVLISPLACGIFAATYQGDFNLGNLISTFGKSITNPFQALGELAGYGAIDVYIKTLIGFTFIYAIIFFIGFFKSAPKSEYSDIEHGSSDWSTDGEQYQILSRNKGIILAENNYLPVDKRGNVNVLVVGRIWFW